MRKLIALLAPVLSAAALGLAPAAAQAEEYGRWYHGNGKPLAAGVAVPVTLEGRLAFYYFDGLIRETCSVSGAGSVENPSEGAGTSEITAVEIHHCTLEAQAEIKEEFKKGPGKVELAASKLPWHGHLVLFGAYDEIEGVGLTTEIEGKSEEVTGTLRPLVGPHYLQFGLPEESGYDFEDDVLESEELGFVLVIGHLRVDGPSGSRITVFFP